MRKLFGSRSTADRQTARRRIDTAYAKVSAISPLWLLVTYVLLIPAFATFYWALGQLSSHQFYAPYAKLEPSAVADQAAVEDNLRRVMIRSFRSHVAPASAWELSAEDVHASDLAVAQDGVVTFVVSILATRYENGEIRTQVGGPQATVQMDTRRMIEGIGAERFVCHQVTVPATDAAAAAFSFDLRALFRPPPETPIQVDATCWDVPQENRFERLLAGWAGDPRPLSGFFPRMLYFSATTITTVGFGDIVPLSGVARLAVALEAVAGWLLAGLFLNAVAWRAAHSTSH